MAEDQTVELSSPACYASESFYGEIPPPDMTDIKELKIAIIGAGTDLGMRTIQSWFWVLTFFTGMGGLGCALAFAKKGFKHIDVYETASNLGFVGAGIQIAPNLVRILDRLGCLEPIEREATSIKGTSIRGMTS
jgi:salicylate hydroxylase